MAELESRAQAEDAAVVHDASADRGPTLSGGEGPTVCGTVEASGAIVAG